MKVYISVDLEGVCGTTDWDEVTKEKPVYPPFQKQMTAEVGAACRGAIAAGANEIVIRDAHDSAKNLIADRLPKNSTLIRGWGRHPYMMMQGLDASFDAVMMIGYHALAGGSGNPLAHTMATKVYELTINGEPASEFLINSYTAMLEKVPVVLISGDRQVCEHAAQIVPGIHTVAVKEGLGASSVNLHPALALEKIEAGARSSLAGDLGEGRFELPEYFEIEIEYQNPQDAYHFSYYPGARRIGTRRIGFGTEDYFEALRMFLFTLSF